MRRNFVLTAQSHISCSNTEKYVVKMCSPIFHLCVLFITCLNTFVCVCVGACACECMPLLKGPEFNVAAKKHTLH